ncbi:hypothetical protein [Streptomyces flavofungini]|uniref:hypothetical protein n=1 Tax=Streptomyces flavofungini TaxID=68200 RepID=UPI0025B0E251|nr:hypothetical protein [Streptomyces flavofungini]WJV49904.1 hypothetical protein QUY26_32905 [Streptomyces flavofungini]
MNEPIECQAIRRGRVWAVQVPEYGVYGYGRSLKAARENTIKGLALVGGDAEIVITPVTPELEMLRAAEEAYATALKKAVSALALRRATMTDIALATRVPRGRVKQLLARNIPEPRGRVEPVSDPD